MSLEGRAYQDCVLRVDLGTGAVERQRIPEAVARLLLGGRGLGTWLLYNELPPGTDPLGADNLLIFVTGPLTGTIAPTAGRVGLVTKSPANGAVLDSYAGGFFGETLRFAGYDALAIRGVAPKPSVLFIEDGRIRLDEADELWGWDVFETQRALRKRYGGDVVTAVIGPAGERKSPIAGIFCETRSLARGGSGAVMGSKNLKAVVIRGSGSVAVYNRPEFEEAVWIASRMLRMSSQIKRMQTDGTVNILELINVAGGLPTRNFQAGQFEAADQIRCEAWQQHWKRTSACHACPIGCTKIAYSDRYGIWIDGPEYETTFALGSNTGVADRDAILYANYLCDKYGIDAISAGGIIAFTMELFERGFISKRELDGVEARFGNAEALVELCDRMGKGEGVGAFLEKGVRAISQAFPGSEAFAMHVKGLELPGYLPRAAKGIALSYAISERGACHLHGSPIIELLGGADPITPEGKALLFRTTQLDVAVVDACILCYFTKFGFTLKEVQQMLAPATGFPYRTPRDVERIGERITNLARLFNLREGFTDKDDTLPARCLREPLPSGPAKGQVVELDRMKAEYYQAMGWDAHGIPTRETLRRLEMDQLISFHEVPQ
ncbi:MAG: aldehyde ferredoxin oxidoreductase family protein [candidate division KSB1 bacterium]|nr:aldehyde ferredoxin oxidoreductase family protein [candidate division KSB1 bacterium]